MFSDKSMDMFLAVFLLVLIGFFSGLLAYPHLLSGSSFSFIGSDVREVDSGNGSDAGVRVVSSDVLGVDKDSLEVSLDGEVAAVARSMESGSMEPTFSGGELLVVVNRSFSELSVGDVVMFNGSSAGLDVSGDVDFISHRVVEKDRVERCVVTRGDANLRSDGCIDIEDVKGRIEVVVYE